MHSLRTLVGLTLIAAAPAAMLSQITVAFENRHIQTDANTTPVVGYVFYATVEGVDGLTEEPTVKVGAGATSTLEWDTDGYYEFQDEMPNNLGNALAKYPFAESYTIGTNKGSVVIPGPGLNTYGTTMPAPVKFSISGVTGSWAGNVFRFDPNSGDSFTVTMNNYSATSPGGVYAYYMDVWNDDFEFEQGDGPVTYDSGAEFEAPVFTFMKGTAADSDAFDDTFGFSNNSLFHMEGGFFNGIGFGYNADLGADVGFVVGTTTFFTLQAIPEPSTYAAIFGALALAGVVVHRRRRA